MTKSCISFTALIDGRYRRSFRAAGLKSAATDLGDGTVVHCWVPKAHESNKPNLLLIHGVGANAMWQWNSFVAPLSSRFNLYVPDLVFFGQSYSTRPDRTETFQAQCVMRTMKAHGVGRMQVVGLSYGGFVAYSMAAQFPEAVERVVIGASGVCMEDKDLAEGMFKVKNLEEAIEMLMPQTPDKLRKLMRLSFYKPAKFMPSCFLKDFIDVMCTDCLKERKELIITLHKDRKLSDLPKITQPTLIVWGEQDQVFPVELGHRLKRLLGENAKMETIKNAGHAINAEKWKEFFKHLNSFVIDAPKPESNGNNHQEN